MPASAKRSVPAKYLALHVPDACAERHANADGLRLLRDRIRDDAVDAERGQQQAESGECCHEQHEEAARGDGAVDDGLDGPELGGRLFGIQFAQSAEDARGERRGRQAGADHQLCARRSLLRCRVVDLRAGSALHRFFVDIVDDADDSVFLFVAHENLADGVLTGPVDASGRGVDEDDSLAVRSIGPGEVAAVQADAQGTNESRGDHIDQRVGQFARSEDFSFAARVYPIRGSVPAEDNRTCPRLRRQAVRSRGR